MHKTATSLKIAVAGFAIVFVSASAARIAFVSNASERLSVRSELIGLQKRDGLRLVAIRDNKLLTINYDNRVPAESKPFLENGTAMNGTVSPDGSVVAISLCRNPGLTHPSPNRTECPSGIVFATVHPDGSDLKEYAEFANPELDFCWSHDLSKVVLNMQDRRNDRHANNQLQILNLATETTEIIAEGPDAFVDPQCWSPDEKHVVYTINKPGGIQTVRQFDTELRTSEDIANGGRATWSPDGKWIAFLYCPPSLYDCTYFAIDTATNRQKVIFKMDGQTPLQWSPDSRFVTYASVARARERTLSELPREMLRLRVRRIEGGAELPVTDFYDGDMKWFNWVSSPPSALTLR